MRMHDKMVKRVLRNVIKMRKERNLSQEQMAALAGISGPYQNQLENGVRSPSMETVARWADALKVDPSRLLQE